MSLLTKRIGILRPKLIKADDIMNPSLNIDDFALDKMILLKSDFDNFLTDCSNSIFKSENKITPYGVPFGVSTKVLRQLIKNTRLIVDNEKDIPNHKVYLIKRQIGEISIASQFHFINNKLFFVVDRFNRHYAYLEQALMHTVNGYFLTIPVIRQDDVERKILRDSDNNYLCLDSHSLFTAKYFSPDIWEGEIRKS